MKIRFEFNESETHEALVAFGFIPLVLKSLDADGDSYDERYEEFRKHWFGNEEVIIELNDGNTVMYGDYNRDTMYATGAHVEVIVS